MPEDGPEHSFRHIAGMVRDRRVAVARRVEPDLVRSGGLAVELEPKALELPDEKPGRTLAIRSPTWGNGASR